MAMIDSIRHFERWCYTRRNIARCEWEIADPQLLLCCSIDVASVCLVIAVVSNIRVFKNTTSCQGIEVAAILLEREGASGINEIYTWREDSNKRAESSKALNFPINQQQLGLRQSLNTGFTGIATHSGKITRGGH